MSHSDFVFLVKLAGNDLDSDLKLQLVTELTAEILNGLRRKSLIRNFEVRHFQMSCSYYKNWT